MAKNSFVVEVTFRSHALQTLIVGVDHFPISTKNVPQSLLIITRESPRNTPTLILRNFMDILDFMQ